jgi:hypothetical protein
VRIQRGEVLIFFPIHGKRRNPVKGQTIHGFGETSRTILRGYDMGDTLRPQERRGSIRLRMMYPAVYTRFDDQGRACDQRMSRSMDMSQGGVRLQSGFWVDSGEVLDISMALKEDLVSFKGKVVYVKSSEREDYEFGICIEDIGDEDRTALNRFLEGFGGSAKRQDS